MIYSFSAHWVTFEYGGLFGKVDTSRCLANSPRCGFPKNSPGVLWSLKLPAVRPVGVHEARDSSGPEEAVGFRQASPGCPCRLKKATYEQFFACGHDHQILLVKCFNLVPQPKNFSKLAGPPVWICCENLSFCPSIYYCKDGGNYWGAPCMLILQYVRIFLKNSRRTPLPP